MRRPPNPLTPRAVTLLACYMDDHDAHRVRAVRAALVLVSRDPPLRDRVGEELGKRYGADYAVAVCALGGGRRCSPRWRGRGTGRAGRRVPRRPDARAPTASTCSPGRAVQPVRCARASCGGGTWRRRRRSRGDHARPAGRLALPPGAARRRGVPPRGHRAPRRVGAGRQGAGFEAVQVIGERWSPRSQELRDMFDRNRVPTGFHDAVLPGRPGAARRARALTDRSCRWSSCGSVPTARC